MEIDNNLMKELLKKEIEKQVKNKLQQIGKKTLNNMIKDVIDNRMQTTIAKNTEQIQQEIKKQLSTEDYGKIIANNIAEKMKDDIIYALSNPNNDNFDEYYDN